MARKSRPRFQRKRHPHSAGQRKRRLSIEELEDRTVPSLTAPVLKIDPASFAGGVVPDPSVFRPIQLLNVNAADTTNADQLQPGGSSGLNLTGKGVTVGIWDGGDVRATHQELTGRVTVIDAVGNNDHATHVAGTIAATGINASAKGMAKDVNIRSRDFNNDINEMKSEAGAKVIDLSNHSYGFVVGWTISSWGSAGTWATWFEDRSVYSQEAVNFGKYISHTQALDDLLYKNPQLLSVWSAGNDRGNGYVDIMGDDRYVAYFSTPPSDPNRIAVGGQGDGAPGYYAVKRSAIPAPPSDGNGGTGYDSLPMSQVAKNTLTVGAIKDITKDPYTGADAVTTSFSSYGPTDDGRIKPDVVGNGDALFSSVASSDTAYATFSGTSMSAPNVTGTAALLLEHYRNEYSKDPRGATLKGILIHNATDAGNPGPDYAFGWGVVDGARAADFITKSKDPTSGYLLKEAAYRGTEQKIVLQPVGGQIKATLTWFDPAPANLPGNGLDDNTKVLVNNLDLWITNQSGQTFYPWTLDPSDPSSPAVRTKLNDTDNVVQVVVDNASGGFYTLHIGHTGTVTQQDYSLLVTGAKLIAPEITVDNTKVTTDEGKEVTNTGSYFDADPGLVTLTPSVGTITRTGTNRGDWTWKYTPPDGPDDTQVVTITARDADGLEKKVSFQLDVNNVAPTIALSGPTSIKRTDTFTLQLGSITDPGDDTVTSYKINWGDGDSETFNQHPTGRQADHDYAAAGTYTITVDLVDEDGTHVKAGEHTVTVTTDAPVVNGDSDSVTTDEGMTVSNTGKYEDPNGDTVTLTASVGTITKTGTSSGDWTWEYTPTDGPDDSQTVTITADDGNTGVTTFEFELTVNNVAPTIALTGNDSVREDRPYTLNLGAVTDPGDDTVTSYKIHWGDGSSSTFNQHPTGKTADHTYLDPGTYTITVDLIDEDGTHVSAGTKTITVDDANPLKTELVDFPTTAAAGGTIQYTATITNTGKTDAKNITFESGLSPYLTLIPDTTKVSPIAVDDVYSNLSAGSVFTDSVMLNDYDPDNGLAIPGVDLVVLPGSVTRVGGTITGTLSINADGSFNYDPRNQQGTEIFSYLIQDGSGLTSVVPATVTFQVSQALTLTQPSRSVDNLWVAQLQRMVDGARDRLAAMGYPAGDLSRIERMAFAVADLPDHEVVLANEGQVYIDRDGPGHGWFVDATPWSDEEFSGSGATISALPGSAADGRLDLLSVVSQQMLRFIYPDWVGAGDADASVLPGVRQLELGGAQASLLAQLRRGYGFRFAGDWWLDYFGQNEKWFVDRVGTWYTITPDGTIRQWNGGPFGSEPVVATVSPEVYQQMQLLFDAPIRLTAAERDEIDRLRSAYGFRLAADDSYNWSGALEKWFQGDHGLWFAITPDGVIRRWDGGRNILTSPVFGKVTSLAYDDLQLLVSTSDGLMREDWTQLGSLRRQFGFRRAADEYFNWAGLGERWFVDRSDDWYAITPDGIIRRWNGVNLLTGEIIATVAPAVHGNLDALFNAPLPLSATSLRQLAQLQRGFGFRRADDEYFNAVGMQEKWFLDSEDRWYAITPDGKIRRWNSSDLQQGEVIATVDPAIYDDPDPLFDAQPPRLAPPAGSPANPPSPSSLTQEQLNVIVAAALERWAAAGLDQTGQSLLQSTQHTVADLPNYYLAVIGDGQITFDVDASGIGWYIDPVPSDDSEFEQVHSSTRMSSETVDSVDLLTTIMHEMGHVIGLDDAFDPVAREDLMYGYLPAGERRLPRANQATAGPGSGGAAGDAVLAPVSISLLPTGKAVEILFATRVDSILPANVDFVAVQGVVNGKDATDNAAFPPRRSDDPDTAAARDATVTFISAAPDLFITFDRLPPVAGRGSRFDFDVVYTNKGTQEALGVVLQVRVPDFLIFDPTLSSPGWTYRGGGVFTMLLGSMPVGKSGRVRIGFAVPVSTSAGTPLSLHASIADDGSQGADLFSPDNFADSLLETVGIDDRRWV